MYGARSVSLPLALHISLIDQQRPPLWITAILVLLILASLYSLGGTLASDQHYESLDLPFSSTARIALSLVWLLSFAALLIGALLNKRLTFALIAPLLTIYGVFNLIWSIRFVQSDYGRGALGFQALITIALLVPIWWLAFRRHWFFRSQTAE
jgi:tryptophan-rich sensory protein